MRAHRFGVLALALLLLLAARAEGVEPGALRVCADPDNRPFSSQLQDGFENKLAELIARDLGAELVYTWWPHQRGLVRRVLNAERCDVLVGVPTGYDPVLWTRPYYRTSYVMAYRTDRGLGITSLDDPALRQLRIGVHVNTPPSEALARRGMIGENVVGYPLYFDSRYHPEDYPGKMIEDLIAGKIDVAMVWGPIAGYFTKKRAPSSLTVLPLRERDPGSPFAFDISMGVRKGDQALKARLEAALDRRRAEIRQILDDFGVPVLDPVPPASTDDATKHRESPGGHDHHE